MMSKMSVGDAAEHFGVSKEAIHNRIRRGSLQSTMEDDVKMVLVDTQAPTPPKAPIKRVSAHGANDKYYKFLEEQNAQLQQKVEKLEDETRTLRDQKELMLIEERIKIEQIYRDKDEQLKNILSSFQAQFSLGTPAPKENESALDAEIEDILSTEPNTIVSLSKYLKEQAFSKKNRKKIKAQFDTKTQEDRIIMIKNKYYLDLEKYSYEDIF